MRRDKDEKIPKPVVCFYFLFVLYLFYIFIILKLKYFIKNKNVMNFYKLIIKNIIIIIIIIYIKV